MANVPEYQKYDYNADYEQAKQEQQKAQDASGRDWTMPRRPTLKDGEV